MRWLVEAADTKTGQETELTIEALTAAEAERLAHYNGLLVSKIYRAARKQAPIVPYARPMSTEAGPPDFSRLVTRARATRHLGLVLTVGGWTALACGAGVFAFVALHDGWGNWPNWREWLPSAGAAAWRFMVGGVAAMTAGSVLRLLAAMALVLRVAARQANRPGAGDPDQTPAAPPAATGAAA